MAFKWATRAAKKMAKGVSKLSGKILKAVEKVPGLGAVVKIAVNINGAAWSATIGPVRLTNDLAHGKNIKHSLVKELAEQSKNAKVLGPIVANIPGVGTGIAAAIAGGAALADALTGVPLDKAFLDGVKACLPPVAVMAVSAGINAAKGKNILASSLEAIHDQLPPAARPGFVIGVALMHGKNLGQAVHSGLHEVEGLGFQAVKGAIMSAKLGDVAAGADAILGSTKKALASNPVAAWGYNAANGVLTMGKKLGEKEIEKARTEIGRGGPAALIGFDTALAQYTGRFSQYMAPKTLTPDEKAAFYAGQGLRGALPEQVKAVRLIYPSPKQQAAFELGLKAATAEAKNEVLTAVFGQFGLVMQAARRGDPKARATLAAIAAKAKAGDKKAIAESKMLAIADKHVREHLHAHKHKAHMAIAGDEAGFSPAMALKGVGHLANAAAVASMVPLKWLERHVFTG